MKAIAVYAAISAVLIAIVAVILSFPFSGPDAKRAILSSAITAFLVQLLAFAMLRRWRGAAVMVAWGIGALARFLVVIVYALIVLNSAPFPLEPALLSLVSFFVICTIIEPLLLER